MTIAAFDSSVQHVLAELERVDIVLRAQVWRLRQCKRDDKFEGLYVSDQDIDEQLARPLGAPRWASVPPPGEPGLHARLQAAQDGVAARAAASVARGERLRLEQLTARFDLGPLERGLLLLALAPELDPRYERLFAYLQDDVTRRRPSVHLALDLLCGSLEDKLAARALLEPGAALLRHRLIELVDDPAHPQPTLLGRHLRLDPRITGHLLDSDELPRELVGLVRHVRECRAARLVAPPQVEAGSAHLAARYHPDTGLLVALNGPGGAGKKTWAEGLCARLGLGLLIVDVPRVLAGGDPALGLRLLVREAALQPAAIYLADAGALAGDANRPLRLGLVRELEQLRGLVFLAGLDGHRLADDALAVPLTCVELPPPTYDERITLWSRALAPDASEACRAELPALATKFRFTGGQIAAAAAEADARAQWRPDGAAVTVADLYAGSRAQSSRKLDEHARAIRPHYTWADIVLPADARQQLRELCDRVRLRGEVHERWGFDGKLSLGKGVNALFSGPSGTGKTMAAEVLAGALNLELYKIDLASVVSKYIGETEKNLGRIFAEAETSNAILFFDEADALFGKRSEVKDAHDRYANIETSYLLQRMEEYEGVTILATNLRKNLDDAFIRRMAFMLAFTLPDEPERREIWRRVWPERTPLDPDLDLAFMARQFKLSGGSIKNIALAAAFLAASEPAPVHTRHLVLATRRELQKMGRMVVPADFGAHAALVE
jgi:hypothetical protein